MDLRSLPPEFDAPKRVDERRARVEKELGIDLACLESKPESIGQADEKNCEQMIGSVPLPVGYAGPLTLTFSDKTKADVHLPLATTEGALVASVNRGCKALSQSGARTSSINHGITRSLAFRVDGPTHSFTHIIREREQDWKKIAEATSNHLKILGYDLDEQDGHVFLTLKGDTGDAMGMNMITIAAQAVGEWIEENLKDCVFVTVAGNVDSDKKPSLRTAEKGRGIEVIAEALLTPDIITSILKSDMLAMLDVSKAKLEIGSEIAGAIGHNLHAANIVAALYLATGQDAAHVVEGSLTDTYVEQTDEGLKVAVRIPAILVGVRGGGTALPAQSQCLSLLLQPKTSLAPRIQTAESIGAAVLAGEMSLLAAQASHQLAKAHRELGR